ncbi:hypothetical protein DMENIID0001_011520 [Sergentomyia squamirostris]
MEDYFYDDYYSDEYVEAAERSDFIGLRLDGIWDGCIVPVCTQMGGAIGIILIVCTVYRLVCYILARLSCGAIFRDIISTICGITLLTYIIGFNGLWIFALSIAHIVLLVIVQRGIMSNMVYICVVLVAPLVLELIDSDSDRWHQIRGVNMAVAMKGMSLALDTVNIPWHTTVGYIFHPATLIFGPWISVSDYMTSPKRSLWTLTDVVMVVLSVATATGTLISSNCLVPAVIPDSWRWLEAYRDAFSFRLGHYFVNYIARTSLILASSDSRAIVHPITIEIPRSLVGVVVAWNLPMHYWLKKYVFEKFRPRGATIAVLTTYTASALLHGLNPQLVVILMHLAAVTWAEFKIRQKLATVFDACVAARRCTNCKHTHRGLLTVIINILFTILAIIQLIYLGSLLDSGRPPSFSAAIFAIWEKWQSLHFIGHWLLLGLLLFHIAT